MPNKKVTDLASISEIAIADDDVVMLVDISDVNMGLSGTNKKTTILALVGRMGLPAHLADTIAAHAASAISFLPNGSIAATNVQAAIQEVRDEATGGGSGAASGITVDSTNLVGVGTNVQTVLEELDDAIYLHMADTLGAHAASAISFAPNGSIAATNVQAAIQEVRDEATGGGAAGFEAVFAKAGTVYVAPGLSRRTLPRTATITSVIASAGMAPTGSDLIIDVKKNGATIFTTTANRPTIPDGFNFDESPTPDVTGLLAGDYLTVDVVQVGSTFPGSDLTVQVELS